MIIQDEYGTYIIEGNVKLLIEPSQKYIDENTVDSEVENRERILKELAELDLIVPRILEDIIEQGNFTIHQSKLDIIERKKLLRSQL